MNFTDCMVRARDCEEGRLSAEAAGKYEAAALVAENDSQRLAALSALLVMIENGYRNVGVLTLLGFLCILAGLIVSTMLWIDLNQIATRLRSPIGVAGAVPGMAVLASGLIWGLLLIKFEAVLNHLRENNLRQAVMRLENRGVVPAEVVAPQP